VSTLAVALIPWYISNIDIVKRSKSVIRIWAGGVHSQHGRYAQLLAKYGAEAKMYTNEVSGRKYRRYLVVIRGKLYEEVVNILRNEKKLRKLAKRYFDVLVEAFRYYSPRGLTGYEIRDELRKLLGIRLTKRLLEKLKEVLRSKLFYVRNWTKAWLRDLFRKKMRGYGFHKKVYACVREFIEEGCNADEWTLKEVCRKRLLGDPWWTDLLPAKCIYR